MATIPPTEADLIRAAIRTADRTKKWTAEKSGIPTSTFHRKLAGHTDFTVREIANIAQVLAVSPASLLPAEFRTVREDAAYENAA